MVGLSAKELLSLMERGQGQEPVTRGLLMLEYAWPGHEMQARDDLPLGDRDRLLTSLRVATFGGSAPLVAACPHCEAEVETVLDLRCLPPESPSGTPSSATFEHQGRQLRYRRPSSSDLRVALTAGGDAATVVAERCLETIPDDDLVAAFGAILDANDPWAEVNLELNCPDCAGTWMVVFDIVDYFWREIESRGRRLLREVHTLARCYGWSEGEILSLSPMRRQLYLGMVNP